MEFLNAGMLKPRALEHLCRQGVSGSLRPTFYKFADFFRVEIHPMPCLPSLNLSGVLKARCE